MVSRVCVLALLLLASPMALAALPHDQYLPPDEQNLRADAPEQQQVLQVTEYSVVVGSQRESNQQPIPITSPTWLLLKTKAVSKGAAATRVVVRFDSEGKSIKRPSFDEASKTLSLNYPLAQYRVLLDLLRNGTVYVQFLSYPNGHVWADLHTGVQRAR
ncbi:hypothetical protein [Pseudomonas turukhanskensis]|uniref:Uncharacterized protein n=1 Tax=Pseudomonas turukhanskensis TaxID=1806536 RepID=A0A9W6NEB2_9PSED|nr:hypothetical protein [Pseudomonas turukhanskensis]GLK87808.1 hypothetical protein GCM10017655_08700 [Pseudomonas turukhanskensis]